MEEPLIADATRVVVSIESPPDVSTKHPEPENPPKVLTPPASEEEMDKRHASSSDLSDIELEDEEDIGEIEPDHYFDGGKIPVFKPTMEQFRSFKKFCDKIDKYGMKSGIVKVIPPPEWRDNLPTLDEAIKSIKIKNPIVQEFAGTYGQYTQANIEKQRSYSLPQWKALCAESQHQPPAKRGERRVNNDAIPKPRAVRPHPAGPTTPADGVKRKRGRPPKYRPAVVQPSEDAGVDAANIDEQPQVPPTPTSPDVKPEADETPSKEVKEEGDEVVEEETPRKSTPKPRGRQPRGRQPKAASAPGQQKSVTSRRMNNTRDANDEVDEEAFKGFNYKLENVDEFTRERCLELEQNYWKTINYGTPMYGADMPGSLFDDRTTSWNVAHLENLLDVLGTKVPGVNTTYVYLGMWKATFAWHLEDVDLYSINYIHFGAPKQWYSISQEDARKFETAMKQLWPNDAKHCDQFLRHKTYLVSPEKLKSQFNIKVNKLVHYEGEFVITYPYGYHSGFNLGYNCAESVNFATGAWLNYGRIARKCHCEADSVWVNVNEIERKLRGEPTPEYYTASEDEDEDDDVEQMPTPPSSVRGRPKGSTKKRKRGVKDVGKEAGRKVKRLKVRIKASGPEPCILCPNDVPFDDLLPTDNGKKAHRLCALYTPETYLVVENGAEKVCNVAGINKDRLGLKCNFCRGKRVAFQCDSRKCTRGYHATCAAAAGVQVDAGPMPLYIDSVEYISEGFDFRCRFHRPKRSKNADSDSLEDNKLVMEYAKTLKKGDVVQAMHLGGDVFAGTVVENSGGEMSVLIDVLAGGDRVEVEWKYLLVLDPAQSERMKPSQDALPLPEHLLNNQDVNASSKKEGIPEIDDDFCDPGSEFKWAEFNSCAVAEVRNPFQKKVDLSKREHLWHYLGKTSTEARAQYTDDPKKPVHNLNSNFLDSVKPVPSSVPGHMTQYARHLPQSAPSHYSYGYASLNNQWKQEQPPSARPEKPYQYKPKVEVQPNIYTQPLPYGGHPYDQQPRHQQIQPRPQAAPVNYPSFPYTTQTPSPAQQPTAQRAVSHGSSDSSRPMSQQSPLTQTPVSARPSSSNRTGCDNSPPYQNYYAAAEKKYSAQKPMEHRYDSLMSPILTSRSPSTSAPTANMMAASSTPPSSHVRNESIQSNAEWLSGLNQYPYLRNSYLRRPKTYISPYATGYGFTPEWAARLQPKATDAPFVGSGAAQHLSRPSSSSAAPNVNGTATAYAGMGNHVIPPQMPRSQLQTGYHAYQYQTPQQFEAQMQRQPDLSEEARSINKFEEIMKQLANPLSAEVQKAQNAVNAANGLGGGWQAGWVGNAAGALSGAAAQEGVKTPVNGVNGAGAKMLSTPTERPEWSPISDAATPVRK